MFFIMLFEMKGNEIGTIKCSDNKFGSKVSDVGQYIYTKYVDLRNAHCLQENMNARIRTLSIQAKVI